MDSSPAHAADFLATLFSPNGRAGLAGALAEGASQRAPPGELAGQPIALQPETSMFAALLSGLVLPPTSGVSLPTGGNALPPAPSPLPGLPVNPYPAHLPAALPSTLPGAPPSVRLEPPNAITVMPPPPAMPPDEGAPVVPASEALQSAPKSPLKAETAPLVRPPEVRPDPLAPPAEDTWRASFAVPTPKRPGSSPPVPHGASTDDPVPLPTSPTVASAAPWRLTERPIKLAAQQPSLEGSAREPPPDLGVTVRQAAASGALPETTGAVQSGWLTTVPATAGAQSTESLIPAPAPFTGNPPGGVDPVALAGRVHWMIDNAVGEARLKLNPPELGALDIRISMVDDKAYVQLAATQIGASELLEAALPRLRELLNVGGLELAGATVSHGGAERSGSQPPAEPERGSLDGESEDALKPVAARRTAGEIDVYA